MMRQPSFTSFFWEVGWDGGAAGSPYVGGGITTSRAAVGDAYDLANDGLRAEIGNTGLVGLNTNISIYGAGKLWYPAGTCLPGTSQRPSGPPALGATRPRRDAAR